MYISCADDVVAVEAEMGYVPNNPLFGLPLDSPQVNPFRNHSKIFIVDDSSQIISLNSIQELTSIQKF